MVSTRRRQHNHKAQKYAVGDKVEVLRVDGLAVGYLLSQYKDDDDNDSKGKNRNSTKNKKKNTRNNNNSNNNTEVKTKTTTLTKRWVVSVEGGSEDEEIVSEKALGRVLDGMDEVEDDTEASDESATFDKAAVMDSKTPITASKTKTKPTVIKKKTSSKTSKTKVSTSAVAATIKGSSSTASKNVTIKGSSTVSSPSQQPAGGEESLVEWQRKRPAPRPKKIYADDKVIEVEMNTGTLFMYRRNNGLHRRVEYTPRV
jgi:hypothetical protein